MPVAQMLQSLPRFAAFAAMGLVLSACVGGGGGSNRTTSSDILAAPIGGVTSEPLAAPAAGASKVALILPLTGNGASAGASMKNAADMALAEFNNPNVHLIVKDDGGSPQGAAMAAQQALGEGAQIILGPLFAQNVAAVGQTARASNVPVLAFSTDSSVAKPGVYLLSFLPETEVDRVVSHAVRSGRRSFAASTR